MTWAHGTEGLADACATSKALDIAYRIPGIRGFVQQGYVVAATDYQGLGTPGEHPYLVGVSEARGVLDIARAAHTMTTVHASTKVLVYGHSQGGQAALFAGQIAPSCTPDLQLVGVAAVAPVSDLAALLPEVTATPIALGYAVMAAVGFHAAYPNLDLASVLTPAARAGLGYVDQHCAADVIDHYAEFTPAQILTQSPLTVPAFAALLEQNVAGTGRPRRRCSSPRETGTSWSPSRPPTSTSLGPARPATASCTASTRARTTSGPQHVGHRRPGLDGGPRRRPARTVELLTVDRPDLGGLGDPARALARRPDHRHRQVSPTWWRATTSKRKRRS